MGAGRLDVFFILCFLDCPLPQCKGIENTCICNQRYTFGESVRDHLIFVLCPDLSWLLSAARIHEIAREPLLWQNVFFGRARKRSGCSVDSSRKTRGYR